MVNLGVMLRLLGKGFLMASGLNSPLSGRVTSGFGGAGNYKSRIIFGTAIIAFVPFLLSTFAASITVGSGALEFGQGSQQAIACDATVYASVGEEWHSLPTAEDTSAGFFRVRAVTISNLDLLSCRGKKLRVRLIDTNGAELQIGGVVGADPSPHVIQIALPNSDAPTDSGDPTELQLAYLAGDGSVITGDMNAAVNLSITGTSVYDGTNLDATSADVTFYLDPTATVVNLDGQLVGRTTVETVANNS